MKTYYVGHDEQGIKRTRRGNTYVYFFNNKKITSQKVLTRIQNLKIPPGYQNVWICSKANGHIQAYGYDVEGRKQYIYHPAWLKKQEKNKFDHLLIFGKSLARLRKHVTQHLKLKKLAKNKIIAMVICLLDKTCIRIGSAQYQSYGLLTLRKKHLTINGNNIIFDFEGKSKQTWHLEIYDQKLAALLKKLEKNPGYTIFKYLQNDQAINITVADVNNYLYEYSGEHLTAKEFRTWRGSTIYLDYLLNSKDPESETMRKIYIKKVSKVLGNTPKVCKQSYIHPSLLNISCKKLNSIKKKTFKDSKYLSKNEKELIFALEEF